jgi:hypothetical protein
VKTTDIPRGKQAAVKDVTDVAKRTVVNADEGTTEDDISRWLLGVPESKPGDSLKETRSIRMEETTTIPRPNATPAETATVDDVAEVIGVDANGDVVTPEKSGRLSWLKGNKAQAKKAQPGKLPPRPASQSTKDSCEAAADILREMTRRR